MSGRFYYYTLLPYSTARPQGDGLWEIDLNCSSDFFVLFAGLLDIPTSESSSKSERTDFIKAHAGELADLLDVPASELPSKSGRVDFIKAHGEEFADRLDNLKRSLQLKRMDFITAHPQEMDLIAHLLEELKRISCYTSYDMESLALYNAIIRGEYGDFPAEYFKCKEYGTAHDIILYYLVRKKQCSKSHDLFQRVLKDIFTDGVTFYFDRLKNILYIAFVCECTDGSKRTYEMCKYFFADILMDIEVRWRCYPLIIGKTSYFIAAEGEQLCGTII